MTDPESVKQRAARAARDAYGRLVAALSVRFRDLAAAEDALGDAFAQALARWPVSGIPDEPEAWLMTVAKNQLRQRARHAAMAADPRVVGAIEGAFVELSEHASERDDARLRLLLVCAHPAIDESVRTPLMLQVVLGLDAARIARAFLSTPAAMSQRLVRAKQKIRDAAIPFEVPEPAERPQRMHAVREAIYAAYSIGLYDSEAAGASDSLADEAIYLASLLMAAEPDDAESLGLYALLRFSHARRAARSTPDGAFTALAEQDVARWDRAAILEGNDVLLRAAALRTPGPFQLEAAIQSAHCQRLFSGRTPWNAIERLYAALDAHWPTVASLVAHAAVLLELDRLDEAESLLAGLPATASAGYAPYWVVTSHLRRQRGALAGAREAMHEAIRLTANPRLASYLESKLTELEG